MASLLVMRLQLLERRVKRITKRGAIPFDAWFNVPQQFSIPSTIVIPKRSPVFDAVDFDHFALKVP